MMEHSKSYLEEAFDMLAEFDWIHNFQVTHFFKENILKNVPVDWLPHFHNLTTEEINELPFIGSTSFDMYPHWPTSLHRFLSKTSKLSIDRTQTVKIKPTKVDASMAKGMNPKKLHEVSWMVSLVDSVATQANCDLIVDIGSGLGYLDHVLHHVYGHRVIGLETSESHLQGAEKRAVKQGLQCNGVFGKKFNITNDIECFLEFENMIRELNPTLTCQCQHSHQGNDTESNSGRSHLDCASLKSSCPRVCLVGLHCCGDLSTSVLSLFDAVKCVQAVCFVCCCYHKMAYTDGIFPKFPMSTEGLKQYNVVQERFPTWQISPFTMRLGAQETRCRWRAQTKEDHESHMQHMAYRGLLEMTEHEESFPLRQVVRKCDYSSFESFLESYLSALEIAPDETEMKKKRLWQLHEKHKDEFPLIEIVTCFQVIMQPVIESLVYKDRMHWLQEKGHANVRVIPVFNDLISPRNLAIVANKSL